MKGLIPPALALLLLLVLSAGYSFMYIEVSDDISRIALTHESIQTLTARDALVRAQEIFLENNHEAIARLNSHVTTDENVINVIEVIERAGIETGAALTVSSVKTVAQDGWKYHEGVEVLFSAQGNFLQLMQLTVALESLPIGARINQTTFERTVDGWFASFSITFIKKK